MKNTEFEFERGEILSNLTLLEDHGSKFPCPYCIEKHLSKIIGYSEEVEMGKEGDEKEMQELAEWARTWRRKIQGAKEHSHEHKEPEAHNIPAECQQFENHPRKLAKCIKEAEG